MSNIEPKAPYVYQPFGIHEGRGERLYAIGGLYLLPGASFMKPPVIEGLTRDEAARVLAVLVSPQPGGEEES